MLTVINTPSLELIYTDYTDAIRQKIRQYVSDNATAADIQQDVMIKIWKKLPTYDGNRGSLFGWIMAITSNTCIDHLRTQNKTNPDTHPKDNDSPAEPDYCLRRELLRWADKLSASQKQIVIMIYFRGYTQFDAAQYLKLPLGTVKTRQRSALLALRKLYSKKHRPAEIPQLVY